MYTCGHTRALLIASGISNVLLLEACGVPSTSGHEDMTCMPFSVPPGHAYRLARNATKLVTCPHSMGWAVSFRQSFSVYYFFHCFFLLPHLLSVFSLLCLTVFYFLRLKLTPPHRDTFPSLSFHLHSHKCLFRFCVTFSLRPIIKGSTGRLCTCFRVWLLNECPD